MVKKRYLFQFVLFFGCLLAVEIFLRLDGHLPGVVSNQMFPPDSIVYEPLFRADSFGISSYMADSPILPSDHQVNAQGFLGSFDYDAKTIDSLRNSLGRKVVMLVGDSYTEGCCAHPIDSSFAFRLMADTTALVLNFGIGATDLVQYQLIVERYVPELKPDLVVVFFYLGNDISWGERPVTPFIPVCYPIKDFNWINSVGPPYLMDKEAKSHFSSPEEAYDFYLRHFTLWSPDANIVERIVRQSVVFSKIYLVIRGLKDGLIYKFTGFMVNTDVKLTSRIVSEMENSCAESQTSVLISAIPSPIDAKNQTDLVAQYSKYFESSEIPFFFPDIRKYSRSDYDGMATNNHFNNSGHRKYYHFADSLIELHLQAIN